MLLYDDGLFLLKNRLGIDVRRRRHQGFISHAHFDHMAKHQLAFCTPETARLYQHRIGNRPVRRLPFEQPTEYAGVTLTTFPAGHMLGSAMLLVEQDGRRLLYTGDFQLKQSATCREAIVPQVDYLVMECTFGRPQFAFPDRAATAKRLVSIVRSVLRRGNVPVIEAYVAGKAQEVTRLLTAAEIPVVQHPLIFAISEIYSELGQDLGEFRLYENTPAPGAALIVPPSQQRATSIGEIHRQERIAITGWAMRDEEARRRRVQHIVPLSDHADYNELLQLASMANPTKVFCVHGPRGFCDDLKSRGHDATFLHRDAPYCPLR